MNNLDYLVTLVIGWKTNEQSVLKVNVLKAGKMGKCKNLNDIDKDQIGIDNWISRSLKQQVLESWSVPSMQLGLG